MGDLKTILDTVTK
jgi:long-chain acyl-CoA synthetase